MAIRTKFIDYDGRNEPKTDFWCIACQKDLKPGAPHRLVKIIDFPDAVHPDDYAAAGPDLASHPIGMDCARKLGLEWSVPAPAPMVPSDWWDPNSPLVAA